MLWCLHVGGALCGASAKGFLEVRRQLVCLGCGVISLAAGYGSGACCCMCVVHARGRISQGPV
jgi:hypothetical protein